MKRIEPDPVLRGVALHVQPLVLGRPRAAHSVVQPEPVASHADALAEARAEGFVEGREKEAAARNAEWVSQLEAAKAQARDEGRAAGMEAASRDSAALAARASEEHGREMLERLERIEAVLTSARAAMEGWRAAAEEDVVALAFEIASRVIGARAIHREALEHMTLQTLREHGSRSELAVHVHPEDFEYLAHGPDARPRWEWVSDPSVALGGVLLRSPQGGLDARIETQLRAIGDELVAHREERRRQGTEARA